MNRRLVGLFAVAALLGGYLFFEGIGFSPSGSGSDAPAPGATAGRSGALKLNPLQDLDPTRFPAIVERPLFNPSRQPRPAASAVTPAPVEPEQPPPPPPPPPEPQGPGPDDYKLLGVSSGPDGRIAALRIAASGDVVYLRKGESVDNWSVVDVGERSVAIGTPENPVTYSLFAAADQPVTGDGQAGTEMPGQARPLPLPLPLPMPQQAPRPSGLPEQHTVPDTGG